MIKKNFKNKYNNGTNNNTNSDTQKKTYNDLENEVSELKDMVNRLLLSQENKNSEVIQTNNIEQPKEKVKADNKYSFLNTTQEEYIEIPPNKRIPVMSLYDGVLVLTTENRGRGKPFEFRKYGTVMNINYSDLFEILHYQKTFAEKGLFYIYDRTVISNNGLQDIYEKILDKEMMDNILSLNRNDLTEKFSNTTQAQRDIIVSIIVRKIRENDEEVDLNKIDILSRIYKKDIMELANEGIFDDTVE